MAKLLQESMDGSQIANLMGYKYLTDTHHESGKNTKVYVHPEGHLMIHHVGSNKITMVHGDTGDTSNTTVDKLNAAGQGSNNG